MRSRPLKRPKQSSRFRRLNDRRIDLIHQNHNGGGLSPDEEVELAELQAYVEQSAPRLGIREAAKAMDALLAQVESEALE